MYYGGCCVYRKNIIWTLFGRIFVWYGRNCKNVLKSKARLMAERINKNERKSKVEILHPASKLLEKSQFLKLDSRFIVKH
jgi:hypothetical protein